MRTVLFVVVTICRNTFMRYRNTFIFFMLYTWDLHNTKVIMKLKLDGILIDCIFIFNAISDNKVLVLPVCQYTNMK